MSGGSAETASRRPRSIRRRIMFGFLLVLLLVGVVAGAVWRAGGQVEAAFVADERGEALAARVAAVQTRVLQAEMRAGDYLRTGGAAERDLLTAAIAQLEDAASAASDSQTLAQVPGAVRAVRAALAAAAQAIEQRRDAVAKLTAAAVALTNAATALAEGAARSGQREFVEPATSLLAAVARASAAATRFSVAEAQADADIARTEAKRAMDTLDGLLSISADSARIQRVGNATRDAFGDFNRALNTIGTALLERRQRLTELAAASQRVEAVAAAAAHAISDERAANRAATLLAQTRLRATVVWASVGATLLGLVIALALGISITKPIKRLATAMAALAAGDLDAAIPAVAARDEIGVMARAVQVFKDTMREAAELRAIQSELAAKAAGERRAATLLLAEQFEVNIGSVVSVVSEASARLQGAAQSLSASAESAAQQTRTVATASSQASQNVQMVSAATEQLTASIGEINQQVTKSSRIAADAVVEAERTDSTVQGLADAAQRIGDVVGLIHTIAAQTNLLALNATIEAARAGVAGKGFAVVAAEVKNLAVQAGKATDDISTQVTAIQATTAEAVHALASISTTIGQMNEIATAIAGAVEQQSAATREIAENIGQAAAGTQAVSGTIAGLTETSGAVGAAAGEVLGETSGLSRQSERLRDELQRFLAHVRAA
jgi:methyl-accepting chemotaxis protein